MRVLRVFLTFLTLVGVVSACSSTSSLLDSQSVVEQDSDFKALTSRFEEIGLVCERGGGYTHLNPATLQGQNALVQCSDPNLEYDGFFTKVSVLYVSGAEGDSGVRQRVAEEFCWDFDGNKTLYFHPDGKFVIDWGGQKFSWDEKTSLMGADQLSWWKFCGQKAVATYKTAEPVPDVEAKNACAAMESAYEGWLASGERVGTVKGDAKYEAVLSRFTTVLAPSGPLKTRVGDQSITDAWGYLEGSGTAFEPIHVYAGALNFVNHLTAVRAQLEKSRNSWQPDFVEESYLREVKRPCGKFK